MGDCSRWDAEVSADAADEADAWDNLLGPSADRQRRERDRALLAVDLRLSDTRLSAPGRRRAHRSRQPLETRLVRWMVGDRARTAALTFGILRFPRRVGFRRPDC